MGIEFGGSDIGWTYNWSNILELARFLNVAMPFNRPIDVIKFFEKPYYWTDQWNVYQEFKQSPEFKEYVNTERIPQYVIDKLYQRK